MSLACNDDSDSAVPVLGNSGDNGTAAPTS